MRNVLAYLESKRRICQRTKFAVLLSYFPFLITNQEWVEIKRSYQIDRSQKKIPIKTLAKSLRYKNAASMSRKLYKVRQWSKVFARHQEEL